MKKLLLLFGLMFAGCVLAQSAPQTASASWTAPTTNTDGSKITGTITYNLYQGVQGTPPNPPVQKGLTGTTAVVTTNLTPGTTQCFAVSAVVAGIESAPSAAACVAIPVPVLTPGVPTQVTIVLR